MNQLTPIKQNSKQNTLELIKEVKEEEIWLANRKSKCSQKTYKRAIQEFIVFLKIERLEDIRTINHGHVIAYRNFMQQQGKSNKTINNRLSAISSLFKHLTEQQIVRINPAQGVERMRTNSDRVEAKVLSVEEVRKMIEAPNQDTLQGLRDKALLHILFYTGCRVSEVCNLRVKDFYEEQGYFLLDFHVKGGKKNRLAIHQELQVSLNRYLKKAGHAGDLESPLILPLKNNQQTNDLNRKFSSRAIQMLWDKYAKEAGITGTSPHSARATFITQALENNCPIEAVQRSVGHSQIKTTQMYDKRIVKYRESASFAVRY